MTQENELYNLTFYHSRASTWNIPLIALAVSKQTDWVTQYTTIFKTFIQQDINFICFIELLWNENKVLISYPGTEQYNFLILNSAKEENYDKVTSSTSTLELTRYRLPSQQMFWATASLKTSTTQI